MTLRRTNAILEIWNGHISAKQDAIDFGFDSRVGIEVSGSYVAISGWIEFKMADDCRQNKFRWGCRAVSWRQLGFLVSEVFRNYSRKQQVTEATIF